MCVHKISCSYSEYEEEASYFVKICLEQIIHKVMATTNPTFAILIPIIYYLDFLCED